MDLIKYWQRLVAVQFCLMATPALGSVFEAEMMILFPPETSPELASRLARDIEEITGISSEKIIPQKIKPSPLKDPLAAAQKIFNQAHAAYKDLDLPGARSLALAAEQRCIKKQSFETCRGLLFHAQMLVGMVDQALDAKENAADAFRNAHLADPSMVLDPRKYPPVTMRAFASACVANDDRKKVRLRLQSNPEGASFQINGSDVEDVAEVELPPGRHIVSAKLLGYKTRNQIVSIAPNDSTESVITLELTPNTDDLAFDELISEISRPNFNPAAKNLKQLLKRFEIDYTIVVHRSDQGTGFRVIFGKTGDPKTRELAPINHPAKPLDDAFVKDLKTALGMPVPSEKEPETLASPPVIKKEPVDEEMEEDDESFVVRLRSSDPQSREESELRKILISPWFWGSVGVVVCIVGGVVLATQLE